MNRNFPPGGWGRNPRRRKERKTPEKKPRNTPRANRPSKRNAFSPMVVIREAGVREETRQRINLRRTIKEHVSEKKYLDALLDARALLATEVMYYQTWRKAHYESVHRAVNLLRAHHERLRRKFPQKQNEKVSRLLKTYWREIRKGEDLLDEALNKITWGEKQLKKLDGIVIAHSGKQIDFAQQIAREEMIKLNRDPYFHALMGM